MGRLRCVFSYERDAPVSSPPSQVPETKGLTLEEMDEAFGDTGRGFARADRERQAAIAKRIGLDKYNAHDPEDLKGHRASDEKHEIAQEEAPASSA